MTSYRDFDEISKVITAHEKTEREVIHDLDVRPYKVREVLEWLVEHEIAAKRLIGTRRNRRDDDAFVQIFAYTIEKKLPDGYVVRRRRDWVRAQCSHERKAWSASALLAAW